MMLRLLLRKKRKRLLRRLSNKQLLQLRPQEEILPRPSLKKVASDGADDGNSIDSSPPVGGHAPPGTAVNAAADTAATGIAEEATTATAPATGSATTGKKRGRPSLGGGTTARSAKNAKKKQAKNDIGRQCRKGARVKVTRGNLYHVLIDEDQKKAIENNGQSVNLHGTVLSGTRATGYKIRFDDLPDGKKMCL
jgi:hypothetical protein